MTESNDENAVDPAALAELRALQIEGEPDLLCQLIDLFLTELPTRLSALRTALAQRDPKALAQAAHALRGSCGNFGAARMTALCNQLERESLRGSMRAAGGMLADLEDECASVRRALEAEKRASSVASSAGH